MKRTTTNKQKSGFWGDPSSLQHTTIRIWMIIIIGALFALLLIMPVRGVMNAVNRLDYISQRLDDYPRMKASHIQEEEEWWNWWLKEVYDKRAEQASFIFDSDEKHESEEEKLAYIEDILRAEKATVISPESYRDISGQNTSSEQGFACARISDGRYIRLDFPNDILNERDALSETEYSLQSQLQAGLPGYICILQDGNVSVYPQDEKEETLKSIIYDMLANGTLDPVALSEKARHNGQKTATKVVLNPKTGNIPSNKYLIYSAAYSDNEECVINVSEVAVLFRFARKRSWALWFLSGAIMVLLGSVIWKTRLYTPDIPEGEEYKFAVKRSVSAMFMTGILILGSVLVIQMISGVNLAQQGATDQAEYLEKVLQWENERAARIEREFDNMYLYRAEMAARLIEDNPKLIDVDSLHSMDHSLGGAGIRVFNTEGKLISTDELLHNAVDKGMKYTSAESQLSQPGKNSQWSPESTDDSSVRYYRALMEDDKGKTTGWVELSAEERQLRELQKETGIREIIGDLHILDTLHSVAVEKTTDGRIIASTWKNWVGDLAKDHGIHTELLYDGYEGIVGFESNKCYSVVFSYGDCFVIVGSENESALVFLEGVLILTLLLSALTMFMVYQPLVKHTFRYQKQAFISGNQEEFYTSRSEYPVLLEYVQNFMIAVFLLSSVLFISTNGNTAGLTYNIVRGTWSRGINATTITTCIMLASVVFAAQRLIDIILIRLGKYLSPKGMTICRLIDSGLTYVGTIVLIIYALSMFGVNTTTLIGGVGATALIFTLGANSLIADVLAGIFIIFEGDYTVGDIVVIDGFRGYVTDISMRTTKIMDDDNHDVKIINNSAIKDLTNQSRVNSVVIVDIPISRSIGRDDGEVIITEALKLLPEKYPKIIGEPEYWGVSQLPEKNPYTGKFGGFKARIAFECLEKDREMLTYQVYRSLIDLVCELNGIQAKEENT